MNRERLQEILDAYGGYPANWPEAERGAAEMLLKQHDDMQRVVKVQRQLDSLLYDWARAPVPIAANGAALAADAVLDNPGAGSGPRWLPGAMVGGALAASVALAALLILPDTGVPVDGADAGQFAGADAGAESTQLALTEVVDENAEAAHDMLVWSSVFTPTPEEEILL